MSQPSANASAPVAAVLGVWGLPALAGLVASLGWIEPATAGVLGMAAAAALGIACVAPVGDTQPAVA